MRRPLNFKLSLRTRIWDTEQQCTDPGHGESRTDNMNRVTGAVGRAIFVILLIITPCLLLP